MIEAAPDNIAIEKFEKELYNIPHLVEIFDLHIWNIAANRPAMIVHLVVERDEHIEKVLHTVTELAQNYGIKHTTVEVEEERFESHHV